MKRSIYTIEHKKDNDAITQTLKVNEYVFSYQKKDYKKAILEYDFGTYKYQELLDEEKWEIEMRPFLHISISAEDENKKVCIFEFMVNMGKEDFKRISKEPTMMNQYIISGETIFYRPEEGAEFLNELLEENIYRDTSHFMVQMIEEEKEEEKYVFKISMPEEEIFIWFQMNIID